MYAHTGLISVGALESAQWVRALALRAEALQVKRIGKRSPQVKMAQFPTPTQWLTTLVPRDFLASGDTRHTYGIQT